MEFEITKLGERGQVVIPQMFRDLLKLKKGEKFMVIEREGTIMLKRIVPPTREEFNNLLKKTQEHARKHNFKEKDMWEAIKKTRK